MKNHEIFELANNLGINLNELKKLKGAKFAYALLKNIDNLEKYCQSIGELLTPSNEFKFFENQRVALCEKFAKKDESGKIIKIEAENSRQSYDIDTESVEWKEAIDKLKEENKPLIEERNVQTAKYNEMLQSETTFEFHFIDLADIPNDITLELMRIISPFIAE